MAKITLQRVWLGTFGSRPTSYRIQFASFPANIALKSIGGGNGLSSYFMGILIVLRIANGPQFVAKHSALAIPDWRSVAWTVLVALPIRTSRTEIVIGPVEAGRRNSVCRLNVLG